VEELPEQQPGPGQVRVRLRVRPINPSDLFTIRGEYGSLPRLPATPGLEGAGVVDAVGEGVEHVRVGQQVVPIGGGTWQESLVTNADAVLPLPPGLTDHQAAMLLVNPTSAWLMLMEDLRVEPGEWILQNAGNSAVGRFVIQLARENGFRTISVVRRRDVIEELRADGADEVICEADEDVVSRVRQITGGKGVRHALDSVGGESGSRLVQALGSEGTMLIYGAISRGPLTIEPGVMLFRGTSVRGWWLSRWMRHSTADQRAALFGALIPLISRGVLHAPVAAEFDLGEVAEAVRMAEGSERNGKVLLVG
jgi:NADPH:quinone reductase-like Zn-dependent oxidoreductase